MPEEFSREQKQAHIEGVEFTIDYGLKASAKDMLLYHEFIKEISDQKKGAAGNEMSI